MAFSKHAPPHLYAVLAFVLYALMNASVKYLGTDMSLPLILSVRFLFGFMLMSPLALREGGVIAVLKTAHIKRYLISAVIGMAAVAVGFYALPRMALADATALGQTYPFFLLLLSMPVLKEEIKPKQYLACVFGFVGVLLILHPQGQSAFFPAMMMLACALCAAASDLMMRYLSRTEKNISVVLWYFLLSGIISVVWWLASGADFSLSSSQIMLLLFMGVCGGLAKLCLTEAFKHLGAGTMSPYSFLGFFVSCALGWIVFHEIPSFWMISGAALILGSAQLSYRFRRR